VAFGLALNGRKGQAARGAMRTRVNRHVPLASGRSGLTDRLCVRRIASGVGSKERELHHHLNAEFRSQQAAKINDLFGAAVHPVIPAGDLNITAIRLITTRRLTGSRLLVDLWTGVSFHASWFRVHTRARTPRPGLRRNPYSRLARFRGGSSEAL
jgi:hypothetical protein